MNKKNRDRSRGGNHNCCRAYRRRGCLVWQQVREQYNADVTTDCDATKNKRACRE